MAELAEVLDVVLHLNRDDMNGESDLDLEYAMALVNPTPITLLQTGDAVEGP